MKNENKNPKKDAPNLDESKVQQDYDQNLIFDEEKQSYTYDVDDKDAVYDHPLPYESVSTGAANDDSTFDEANPYVGNEYEANHIPEDPVEMEYGMHVDDGKILNTSKKDRLLSQTEEDNRDDLDAEGYPKNS
ncbi:MAG: hypothetical protein EOO99_01840 [Pedobacter sp.]|nr:MAG: hypothetical protein EOO99_01840 [Pedobacter sp.]